VLQPQHADAVVQTLGFTDCFREPFSPSGIQWDTSTVIGPVRHSPWEGRMIPKPKDVIEIPNRYERRDHTDKEDTVLVYALIIFAIGALGGLTLAGVYVLRGRLAPWPLSLLHAALGAIGLLILIYAAVTSGIPPAALVALIILVVAALGGFYLASLHLRGQVAQRRIVFIHASVAVIGFLTLLGVVAGFL
jgi:hypothetical protein